MLGVPKSLFYELVNHLDDFKSRFQSLETDEVVTITLLHLRQGDSFNYIHGSLNRVRAGQPVKLATISKAIRKCVLILAGTNPYLKETQKTYLKDANEEVSEGENSQNDDDFLPNARNTKKTAQRKARDCYYAGPSFNGLREGPMIGAFFRKHVGWFATDLSVTLDEGTSWFDRCMQQSRLFLKDQVSRLERRSITVKSSNFT